MSRLWYSSAEKRKADFATVVKCELTLTPKDLNQKTFCYKVIGVTMGSVGFELVGPWADS